MQLVTEIYPKFQHTVLLTHEPSSSQPQTPFPFSVQLSVHVLFLVYKSYLVSHYIDFTVQVGLILCQGYIPEKCHAHWNCANETQNSHL